MKKRSLEALRGRLVQQKRQLIREAAELETLPPNHVIRQIGDCEVAVSAIEAVIEESPEGA